MLKSGTLKTKDESFFKRSVNAKLERLRPNFRPKLYIGHTCQNDKESK